MHLGKKHLFATVGGVFRGVTSVASFCVGLAVVVVAGVISGCCRWIQRLDHVQSRGTGIATLQRIECGAQLHKILHGRERLEVVGCDLMNPFLCASGVVVGKTERL